MGVTASPSTIDEKLRLRHGNDTSRNRNVHPLLLVRVGALLVDSRKATTAAIASTRPAAHGGGP
jgi:hypothetical protein